MTGDCKQTDPPCRSERSRQAILTATTDLVGEVGYSKVTAEAIAADAGLGYEADGTAQVNRSGVPART
jgi:AcrR family transcriptional regulator